MISKRFADAITQRVKKIALIENWPDLVVGIRRAKINPDSPLLVRFRSGGRLQLRHRTQDVAILHEVFLEGSYRSLEKILKHTSGSVTVVDIGAHIGCFTLRSLWANPNVFVESYEPGLDNRDALIQNLNLNSALVDRVQVYESAVAGTDGTALYFHNPSTTVDSSLYGSGGGVEVSVVSFRTVLSRCRFPIVLVKIDIEGAEFALIESTSAEDWKDVPAVMAETHPDPSGKSTPEAWLQKMCNFGFVKQSVEYSTVLLTRS